MSTTQQNATFSKLRSGDWGVRVQGPCPGVGDQVQVAKKDGTTKTVRVTEVVWSDGRAHLCAIADDRQQARPAPSRRAARTRTTCRGCGGPIVDCSYQRAGRGYCGSCLYDEI